jgi:hypothetical protein
VSVQDDEAWRGVNRFPNRKTRGPIRGPDLFGAYAVSHSTLYIGKLQRPEVLAFPRLHIFANAVGGVTGGGGGGRRGEGKGCAGGPTSLKIKVKLKA